MFGDHQPKFVEDSFYDNICGQIEGVTETDILMNQYRTPFIIWANYEIPKQDQVEISTNYLGVLLQEMAGVPASAYFAFLSELSEKFPVITTNGIIDDEGNYFSDIEELNDYRILQYRYLFEPRDIKWGY